MKVHLQATPVYYRNAESKAQILVNRGGAGSSKSYSLGQLFMSRFLQERGKKFLILRKTFPALRLSVWLLWNELLEMFHVRDRVKMDRTSWNCLYGDNLLHFGSLDEVEKIKSSDWNYIWLEEANEFTLDDFRVLKLRLRARQDQNRRNQMFMSFNPVDAFHWIKTDVIDGKEDSEEIHSTYMDNPFLSDDYVATVEGLKEQNQNYWSIYGLGEWGKLEDLIYTNWDVVDSIPSGGDDFYGLDFGFNNPSVLTEIKLRDKEIWERELLYETHLNTPDLIGKMKELIPEEKRRLPIYADPSDPEKLDEIGKAKFNIHPGNNSVKDGIDHVSRYRTHILRDSENAIKEKRSYSYRKDRSGRVLDEPVKFKDHYMDAERYAIHTHLLTMEKPKGQHVSLGHLIGSEPKEEKKLPEGFEWVKRY